MAQPIKSKFGPVSSIKIDLEKFVNDNELLKFIHLELDNFLSELKSGLFYYIEYPYVDKLYRDTYYNYYSKKRLNHGRDCIRISLFDREVSENDFRLPDKINSLINDEVYLGFMVFRPIKPKRYCRSVLSLKAFNNKNSWCLSADFKVLVNGVIFEFKGFPHTSQDADAISCADAATWTLLEYFGNKFTHYRTVLPSHMRAVLKRFTHQRQYPSNGLDVNQISFTLRKFGFGARIHSSHIKSSSKYPAESNSLAILINDYVESGIPVIASIESLEDEDHGHALTIMGHGRLDFTSSKYLSESEGGQELKKTPIGKVTLTESAHLFRKSYIVMDDNDAPYSEVYLDDPYCAINPKLPNDLKLPQSHIQNIVVPLYEKIFLDAVGARNLIFSVLQHENPKFGYTDSTNTELIFRLLLVSGKSFKFSITKDPLLDSSIKEALINTSLSRFIWLAEFSSLDLYKKGKRTGFILVDATSSENASLESIICIAFPDKVVIIDEDNLLEPGEILKSPHKESLLFVNNLNKHSDEQPAQPKPIQ